MIDAWLGLPIGLKCLTVMLGVYVALNLVLGPRRAWQVWRRFGHALGDFIARAVLTVFYFLVMPLFALITRLTRDPLGTRAPRPAWRSPEAAAPSVDEALRQF
jgi:hypothetical protein